MEESSACRVKMVVIGDYGVGKSSIVSRYAYNDFASQHKSTLGVDLVSRKEIIMMQEHGTPVEVKLNMWDTAGDEKFRSLTRSYYRDAHAVMVIYDVTERKTLRSVDLWLKEIQMNAPSDTLIFLVGNKNDMVNNIQVGTHEGRQVAAQNGIPIFMEVSAKSGEGIDQLFSKCLYSVAQKIITTKPEACKEERILVGSSSFVNDKKKKKCC